MKPAPGKDHLTRLQRNSEGEFRTLFAGFGSILVLPVIWLALFIPWPSTAPILGFDGQPPTMLATDVGPQKRAHLSGMLVLAVLALTILFFRSPRIARDSDFLASMLPYVSVVLGLAVAFSSLYWVTTAALPATTVIGLYGGVFGAFANPSRTLILAAMVCALLFIPVLIAIARRVPSVLLWAVAIAYAAFLLGAGFFGPILLDRLTPEQIGWIDSHFDAVVGAKQTLAQGLQDRDFGYSLIFNLAQASLSASRDLCPSQLTYAFCRPGTWRSLWPLCGPPICGTRPNRLSPF